MKLWQDGIVALLAAIGMASILWAAVRTLLFTCPITGFRALALIPASGDGSRLEEQIRSLTLLNAEQSTVSRVLLVDCGLNDEGKKLCRLLAESEGWVVFCGKEEIPRYLP